MDIFIPGRVGLVTVSVGPSDSVFALKEAIHRAADIPIAELSIHQGHSAWQEDRRSLESYSVQQGSRVVATQSPFLAQPQTYCVESAGREDVCITARRYDTVDFVKDLIKLQTGAEKCSQRLFFKGEELEDHYTLAHYAAGHSLQLLLPCHLLVTVEARCGRSILCIADLQRPVKDLRLKAEDKLHAYGAVNWLVMDDAVLDDSALLGAYPVTRESVLHLDTAYQVRICRQGGVSVVHSFRCFDSIKTVRATISRLFGEDLGTVRLYHSTQELLDDQRVEPALSKGRAEIYVVRETEALLVVHAFPDSEVTVVMDTASSVEEVRRAVLVKHSAKKLIYQGQTMEGAKKLVDYGITTGAILHTTGNVYVKTVSGKRVKLPAMQAPVCALDVMIAIEKTQGIPRDKQRLAYQLTETVFANSVGDGNELLKHHSLILMLPTDQYLTVTLSDGSKFHVCASTQERVKMLKRRIAVSQKVPVERQTLSANGVELVNSRFLSAYGLSDTDQLTLLDADDLRVNVKTGDKKVREFCIKKRYAVKDVTRMLLLSWDFWFLQRAVEPRLYVAGRELGYRMRISETKLKDGGILIASVEEEVRVTVKCGYQEPEVLMFINTQTVKEVMDAVGKTSFPANERRDAIFMNRTQLAETDTLKALNVSRKCVMEYLSMHEKSIVYVQLLSGKVLNIGLREANCTVRDLREAIRPRKGVKGARGLLLFQGKILRNADSLAPAGVRMWSTVSILLPGELMLRVKPTVSAELCVAVLPSDTVESVKIQVSKLLPWPASKQQLLFRTQVLEDKETVSSYGILSGHTVFLLTPKDILVRVQSSLGKQLWIPMDAKATVAGLICAIEKKSGWLRSLQEVFYRREEVDRKLKLADLTSQPTLDIEVSIRPRLLHNLH